MLLFLLSSDNMLPFGKKGQLILGHIKGKQIITLWKI